MTDPGVSVREGMVPWPDEVAAAYVEAGYWLGRPLGDRIWQWAERSGHATALVDGDRRLGYRKLAELTDGLATGLRARGVQPGDTILVQLPNCWEFVVLTLACLRLGVAPVMALPAHRGHELRHLAELAQVTAVAVASRIRDFDHAALGAEVVEATPSARLLMLDTELRELAVPADDPVAARAELDAAKPSSRDVAVLLLSGGTTGLPKLIARTHDDYDYNARASAQLCGLDRDSVYLVALPAGHNFPLACPGLLGTFMTGGRVVLTRSPDPTVALPIAAAEGVTTTAVVPAVAQRWIDAVAAGAVEAPPSLQLLQVGGARLAPAVAGRVAPVLGCDLQQVFGMAEGLLNYTRLDDPIEQICQTQGRPLSPADEIRIVDERDEPVLPGEMGALLTRGPYTPRGYFRGGDHNARAFDPQGWYRSGDVVRLTAEGNLVVEGRDKDMINRGGEKVSAEEVESLIYGALAGVARVAAVAVPDADLGERVGVVVVLAEGADVTLDDIRTAFEGLDVARYKNPERLFVVDELPLTKVGKIDKKSLREYVAGRSEQ